MTAPKKKRTLVNDPLEVEGLASTLIQRTASAYPFIISKKIRGGPRDAKSKQVVEFLNGSEDMARVPFLRMLETMFGLDIVRFVDIDMDDDDRDMSELVVAFTLVKCVRKPRHSEAPPSQSNGLILITNTTGDNVLHENGATDTCYSMNLHPDDFSLPTMDEAIEFVDKHLAFIKRHTLLG